MLVPKMLKNFVLEPFGIEPENLIGPHSSFFLSSIFYLSFFRYHLQRTIATWDFGGRRAATEVERQLADLQTEFAETKWRCLRVESSRNVMVLV